MVKSSYTKALDRHNKIYDAYLAVFGEHSLDRVIYCEPFNATTDEIDASSRLLAKAIADNKPLEQIDEEIWNNLIF